MITQNKFSHCLICSKKIIEPSQAEKQKMACMDCLKRYGNRPENQRLQAHLWRNVPRKPAHPDFFKWCEEAKEVSSADILEFMPERWPAGRQTWRDALAAEGQRRRLLPAPGRPGAIFSPDYTKGKDMITGQILTPEPGQWVILATMKTGHHVAEMKGGSVR